MPRYWYSLLFSDVHIYIYIYIYTHICIYIYRERDIDILVHIHIPIYIYIYTPADEELRIGASGAEEDQEATPSVSSRQGIYLAG